MSSRYLICEKFAAFVGKL